MHIFLEEVIIHNFLSIGDATVKLNNVGFTLIEGINNKKDDLAKANGAGKTAILESVVWALCGETIRDIRNVVNIYSEGGTFVDLKFKVNSDNYRIIRYKDHIKLGTTLHFYVNGENKSGKGIRDTEAIVKEYLPEITSELLGSVIVLGQGLPQRFTKNTPSGRKEVLEKLSKSDFMIQDIKDKLTSRKQKLTEDLNSISDKLLVENSILSMHESNLLKLENSLAVLSSIEPQKKELEEKEKENIILKEQLDNIIEKEKNCSDIFNNLNEEYQSSLKNNYKELDDFKDKFSDKKTSLLAAEKDLKSEITSLKEKIISFENIKDICPTCHQKLPNVHKINTSEMHIDLIKKEEELTTHLNVLNTFLSDYDKEEQKFREIQEIGLKHIEERLNNSKKEKRIIDENREALNIELNKLSLDINNLKNIISTYNLNVDKLKEDKLNTKTAIDEISKKILYLNIDKEDLSERLEYISKMSTIATREFRGFLLQEVIYFIEEKAKQYSQIIFETDKLDFKLDGNSISVSYCNKEFASLSSGEKQKVDVIIQFALRDMLEQFIGISSNILCLDEIFDGLDQIGCDSVIKLISTALYDIESIYLITHHTDSLNIPYDYKIRVIKDDNGISRIE